MTIERITADPSNDMQLDDGNIMGVGEVEIAHFFPASLSVSTTEMMAAPVSDDTRSEWIWVRLVNGDLLLATFPRGEGYFSVENDVAADYKRATEA